MKKSLFLTFSLIITGYSLFIISGFGPQRSGDFVDKGALKPEITEAQAAELWARRDQGIDIQNVQELITTIDTLVQKLKTAANPQIIGQLYEETQRAASKGILITRQLEREIDKNKQLELTSPEDQKPEIRIKRGKLDELRARLERSMNQISEALRIADQNFRKMT